MVITHIRRGHPAKALNILKKYIVLSFEKDYYLGICYFEMGDLAKAETHLKKALQLKKDPFGAQLLAQIYMQQERWDEARQELQPYHNLTAVAPLIRIISADANHRQKYLKFNQLLRKAMEQLAKKQYPDCVQTLQSASEYADDQGKIYNQIGGIYFNFLKDKHQAKIFFEKAHKLAPDDLQIKMNYAKSRLT